MIPVPFTIGVSLKMYLGHTETLAWATAVGRIAAEHRAVTEGRARLFVVPSFPALVPVRDALAGTSVQLGAQNLFWEDVGPYTGEVSGRQLAEIGCDLVEIGHAERRTLFGETNDIVARKVVAAHRNRLIPLLCVGESDHGTADEAAARVCAQLDDAFSATTENHRQSPIIVAYEPLWAIGQDAPADPEYIRRVIRLVSEQLERSGRSGATLIYGGSAGPGLLGRLVCAEGASRSVRGLFLGRFAHRTATISEILDEILELR